MFPVLRFFTLKTTTIIVFKVALLTRLLLKKMLQVLFEKSIVNTSLKKRGYSVLPIEILFKCMSKGPIVTI